MALTPEEQLELHALNYVEQQNQSQQQQDPTSGMNFAEKMLAGAGRGLQHTVQSVGNMIPGVNKLDAFSDQTLQNQAETDAPLLHTGAGQLGNFIGEGVATLPVGLGAGKGAQLAAKYGYKLLKPGEAALRAMEQAPLLSRLARGEGAAGNLYRTAAEGAGQGVASADPGERGAGAVLGAGAGALLPLAGKATSFLRKGMGRTPEAQEMLNRGVDITPGQMNPGGLWSSLEEKAQALPVIGDWIKGQRGAARREFQQKIIQDVSPPHPDAPTNTIGLAPDDPEKMMAEAKAHWGNAWTEIDQHPLNQTTPSVVAEHAPSGSPSRALRSADEPPIEQATAYGAPGKSTIENVQTQDAINSVLDNLTKGARLRSGEKADFLDDVAGLKQDLEEKLAAGKGTLTVGHARDLLSQIKQFKNDAFLEIPANGRVGQAWKSADQRITQIVKDALPDNVAAQFDSLNNQYARYHVVQDAVERASKSDRKDFFTPYELSSSVAHATNTGELVSGDGLLRDWSKPFARVFSQYEPKTGWVGPAMGAIGEGLGAAGVYANPLIGGSVVGALAAPYTSAGRHFLQGSTRLNKASAPLNNLVQAANRIAPLRQAALTGLRQHNPIPGMLGYGNDVLEQGKQALANRYDSMKQAVSPTQATTQQEQSPQQSPQMAKGGKVATVMREWGQGKLHSGSKTGPVVTNQKQAVAIALSEERKADKA